MEWMDMVEALVRMGASLGGLLLLYGVAVVVIYVLERAAKNRWKAERRSSPRAAPQTRRVREARLALASVAFLSVLGAMVPLSPARAEAVSAECPATYCLSPDQFLSARESWRMKREFGETVLFVDIRSSAEALFAGTPPSIDARVTFVEPAPGILPTSAGPEMIFRADFREKMDELLRARRHRHDQPLILLCRSAETARLAALNLQEHGYTRVLLVIDGIEGVLAKA